MTTIYIGGIYEYQAGATTHYYEGNALRRTGYAADNGVKYLLQDHLKSSSSLINQNGTVNGDRNYFLPFGGKRGTTPFNGLTTKRFTGQYHEASLPGGEGLSYYGARWYDAKLGKFLTPDSIVPGPSNPQAFNRYSYVKNRPLVMVDPTGHYDIKPGDAPYTTRPSTSNVYLPIVSNQQTQYTYLPVISNQQYRPPAVAYNYQPACPGSRLCLSTPTPTATPTSTPTPGAMLMQGPTPTPTYTHIAVGNTNWGGMYWTGIEAYMSEIPDIMEKFGGTGSVVRLGKPIAKTIPWIGYGVAIVPNVYSNLRYGDGFGGRKLYVDFLVDSGGWAATNLSAATGTAAGLATAPVTGPVGPVVGYVSGAFGGNALWDWYGAPWLSAKLNEGIDYFTND